MPEWTEQQKQAIDRREGGLLVSAAAGSGKTAVLSHRTVKYVSEGGSLSRLLIVTFTRLAASEMKQRISSVLAKEYKKNPSEHLKREKISVYGAKISTIDGYSAALLRQHFQRVGLSPDFSVVSESEYADIRTECLEKQLEEYYSSYKNDFGELLKLFGGEQNSKAVSEAVNRVYECLCTVPFPEKWLDYQLEKHKTQDYYIALACDMQAEILSVFKNIYGELLSALPFNEKGMAVVEDEYTFICHLRELLKNGDWDGACREVRGYVMKTSPICKSDCPVSQKYSFYRNLFKKNFLTQQIFLMDTEAVHSDSRRMYSQIKALFAFVREYLENIRGEFRKRNRYSFDFIAQSALSLLVEDYDHQTGEYTRTPLAEELSDSFDEVMIDEYQDVNDIQDLFFRAISDDGEKLFAVGDVKQSIYRFRHANPKNFIRRAEELNVIYLNKNFRSRKSILDFINFIFEGLFSEECCGMVYSDQEKLYAGLPDKGSEDDVEYLFSTSDDEEEKAYVQATAVAERISQLMDSRYQVYDKEADACRPLRLGDVAILAKSIKAVGPIYEKVFRNKGLNVAATGMSSFWDSVEVNTVIAFLNIIDNPYDDLAFFAVMFSDIYAFGAEKIARIKLCDRGAHLCDACRKYAEQTGDEDCTRLLSDLKRYHLLSKNLLPDRLIRQIYSDTSYPEKVSCLTNGYLRRENLMRFYDFASGWCQNNGAGLYDFLVGAEIASKNAAQRPESSASSPDSVSIMTIHGSKGLEFPVCFLVQVDTRMNIQETKGSAIFCDERDGISARIRDEDMIYQTTTLPMEVMKMGEVKNLIAEEMRVLYVALTRAREKLIIISSTELNEKKLKAYAVSGGDGILPYVRTLLAGTLTYEDLMLFRLVHHSDGGDLRTGFSRTLSSESGFTVKQVSVSALADTASEEEVELITLSREQIESRILSSKQESALSKIPAKLAVTELIKGSYDDQEGRRLFENTPSVKRPRFVTQGNLDPAQRGTAMHKYCRYANLSAETESEIKRLVEGGYLSEEEGVSLNRYRIDRFRKGFVAKLIASADEVRREDEFVVRLPASLYSKNADEHTDILVQGAMDLLVRRGDELILVDYKTDKAEEEQLLDRYLKQLDIYRLAAEKAYGLPVTEVYIWSFYLSKEIDCTSHLLNK